MAEAIRTLTPNRSFDEIDAHPRSENGIQY
jgi:hypothetical protein